MRTYLMAVLVVMVSSGARSGTVLDRVVATVNGRVILLSDWEEELRVESFLGGRALGELSREERRAALDRLIDQELVKEQVHGGLSEAKAEEIDRQLDKLKGESSRQGSKGSWEAELESYGLTEKILRKHISLELEEMRLIDERFRPSVQVSRAEIEAYYQHELLSKLPGSAAPSLAQASAGIRQLLIEQKVNQMLSAWLESLRRQARIRIASEEPVRSTGKLP